MTSRNLRHTAPLYLRSQPQAEQISTPDCTVKQLIAGIPELSTTLCNPAPLPDGGLSARLPLPSGAPLRFLNIQSRSHSGPSVARPNGGQNDAGQNPQGRRSRHDYCHAKQNQPQHRRRDLIVAGPTDLAQSRAMNSRASSGARPFAQHRCQWPRGAGGLDDLPTPVLCQG